MVLRLALLCALVTLATVPAASGGTSNSTASWAEPQIALVVKAGFMSPTVEGFRPLDPLDQASLQSIVDGLTALHAAGVAPLAAPTTTPATATVAAVTTTAAKLVAPPWKPSAWKATSPTGLVTVAQFDRVMVGVLGLKAAAAQFYSTLSSAGLHPPARAGTETVARLLGLRYNHPAAEDALELLPDQPITRAEAAFSVARALALGPYDHAAVEQDAAAFAPPALTPWQQRVLTTAVSYVGYPYVWGGTSPTPRSRVGVQAQGGFDCSGLVWQVYKLTPYPDGPALATTIEGRTTYQMAGEGTKAMRIVAVESLEPGDVLFFGRGPSSKPGDISHAGIYLGNGWFVHSSGNGTTIAPFSGWYRTSFAWARRPLREAGLDS